MDKKKKLRKAEYMRKEIQIMNKGDDAGLENRGIMKEVKSIRE